MRACMRKHTQVKARGCCPLSPAKMRVILVTLAVCASTAWGQVVREPHIGYLYPAGAQRGTVCRILLGGQFLNGPKQVDISGEGVSAKIIKWYRPPRNLQKEQRLDLQARLKEVRNMRTAERSGKSRPASDSGKDAIAKAKNEATKSANFRPYDHPLLYDLENQSLAELAHLSYYIFFPRQKLQTNAQIGEMVLIEVTIDKDARPGDRELRLAAGLGLTNPMVFQVGQLPEVREYEPNDPKSSNNAQKPAPVNLPVTFNGQIMPGDVDIHRFRAKKGQELVIDAHARHLIPYLADAVPGWFQATLALYDDKGNEIAFADDYNFNPDPVLHYKIPADGVYELEIRDSIYRGRQDFVYRIGVGETPFITHAFPLGGRTTNETVSEVAGWNLTKKQMTLNTKPGLGIVRHTALRQNKFLSNEVTYAVDLIPDCLEAEPNDTQKAAQKIAMPKIVNGRINKEGDVDVFKFNAKKGNEIVAEVYGRRLNSPLDSLLRLTDASGKVLEWNDDYEQKEGHLRTDMGLLTHAADSYLTASIPKDGAYYVHLIDAQNHGGDAYGYRLRITKVRPDFDLRITPSSINVMAGRTALLTVHALRKDGYDGEIKLALKDAPAGFELTGASIPKGQDSVRMTLKAPLKAPIQPFALKIEGSAYIGGRTVRRQVVPSEDMMQAFLWRHLNPSKELAVLVKKARYGAPAIKRVGEGPVRIPEGGTAKVQMTIPKNSKLKGIKLELNEPPEGVSLKDVKAVPGKALTFTLETDGEAAKAGLANNLIVEVFTMQAVKGKPRKQQRVSLGFLPAIPFEVVKL